AKDPAMPEPQGVKPVFRSKGLAGTRIFGIVKHSLQLISRSTVDQGHISFWSPGDIIAKTLCSSSPGGVKENHSGGWLLMEPSLDPAPGRQGFAAATWRQQ